MPTGAITSYIDVAQLVLYGFWIFFAGLIYYLHRENKREGYPLVSDRSERAPRVKIQGFPEVPPSKTYKQAYGLPAVTVPRAENDTREIRLRPVAGFPGAPQMPTGNAMLDAVGPGSYANRADTPDLTVDNKPKIVPLRVAQDHALEPRDLNPRGLPVVGADGVVGGTVRDVWVDRSEVVARYLEVELAGQGGGRRVLLPTTFARVMRRRVGVKSILGSQFANVPALRNPDQVTLLEEDKIVAYYGGGTLYATPARAESML